MLTNSLKVLPALWIGLIAEAFRIQVIPGPQHFSPLCWVISTAAVWWLSWTPTKPRA